MMLKTLHNPGKPPPSDRNPDHPRKKHERPRKANQSQCTFDNESSDDILDMEEDEEDYDSDESSDVEYVQYGNSGYGVLL